MKWIIFDMAGVVVHMYFGGRLRMDVDGKDLDLKDLYGLYDGPVYTRFMKGDASEEEVIRSFLERENMGLSVEQIKSVMRETPSFIDGMPELLDELKNDYSLAVLTNEGREWVECKIRALGLERCFEFIIESNKLHLLKPSREIFEKALEILDAEPDDCLFIDDKEANCAGAEEVGIRSILFRDTERLKKDIKAFCASSWSS